MPSTGLHLGSGGSHDERSRQALEHFSTFPVLNVLTVPVFLAQDPLSPGMLVR